MTTSQNRCRGDTVTGGQVQPLLVAGVSGGAGTSTWVRVLGIKFGMPVQDLGVYGGGRVDVLVSSNHASSTAQIEGALNLARISHQQAGLPHLKPLLVVMHIAPGSVTESKAYLRKALPHLTALFQIAHHRDWPRMVLAPGSDVPTTKDLANVLEKFPFALRAMYTRPGPPPAPLPPAPPASHALRSGLHATPPTVLSRAGPGPPQWPPHDNRPQAIHRIGQGG